MKRTLMVLACAFTLGISYSSEPYRPPALSRDPGARFQFEGFVGQRIEANVRHWLIPTPTANPGMLEMFEVRDREPVPNLVPWAGEFVGKYLISGVQAMRMSRDPELEKVVSEVVRRLIKSQAEDGYLGPFRKHERLLGHWDLWGHYHCMLGLLLWHEATGDNAALECAKRAGDLVCRTFLGTGKRALDAKSDEMNLAIIHALGWLYRITEQERYLKMMLEIEKDWESAGDYLRTGLRGVEFYQSPRPRWESLHNLQGLVELNSIRADNRYLEAFEHHWRSIARFDLRNTGGFSSGEQATGNPYAPTPIETCCTIAWMAMSTDMLRLTGDPRVADLLELATFNAWAGAQHPSGRWCTYNTPMDGAREASAHTIVFQSRAGTPELNCCSVNGPRGWGMLVDWALMRSSEGLVLNWLGPMKLETKLENKHAVRLEVTGNYPVEPRVKITIDPATPQEFTLLVRVPEWSGESTYSVNRQLPKAAPAGSYLKVKRRWEKGDTITLNFDLPVRAVPGDRETRGQVSLYRGPLLLAYDQKFNAFDPASIPKIPLRALLKAQPVSYEQELAHPPLLLLEAQSENGTLRLCDFATAGASGTHYRSWLKAADELPPTVVTRHPADGKVISRGQVVFRWTGPRQIDGTYALRISETEAFRRPLLEMRNLSTREAAVAIDERFEPGKWYYWDVVASKGANHIPSVRPSARFQVSGQLEPVFETIEAPRPTGPARELVAAPLLGKAEPAFGEWAPTESWSPVAGPDGSPASAVALNGTDQRLIYKIGSWPEEDYTLALKFRVRELPSGRIAQIFSAWAAGMDDPLRVTIDRGQLFARIEAGTGYSTAGVPIQVGTWYDLRVIKEGTRLALFLDDKERASCNVPEFISSRATDFALGGNPHYTGNEFAAVEVQDLQFFGEAKLPRK